LSVPAENFFNKLNFDQSPILAKFVSKVFATAAVALLVLTSLINLKPGNTKGGSINLSLTTCFTGMD